MVLAGSLLDYLLHLDRTLEGVINSLGSGTYVLLFLVIFAETGLVVTPFLPGDSLLFAAGALSARANSPLNPVILFLLLTIAAILGDTVNYWIGKYFGPRIFHRESSRFLKKEHLDRTHAFFEKYGGKTIVIARFTPIVRTMAPFVAGIGAMTYSKFLFYNVTGGIIWVGVCVFAGYYFGQLPFVKNNFTVLALAVVFLSLLPPVIDVLRARRERRLQSKESAS